VNAEAAEPIAYEDLYRAHYARVVGLCRQLLGDASEAEDVAQEVFLRLFRAYQSPHGAMMWGAWLTRVAVNACHDRRRSGWWKWWRAPRGGSGDGAGPEDLHPEDARLAAGWAPEERNPEQEALGRETRERIWDAFRALPPRQQEVFLLRYQEGWPISAVAKALGLSAGSVKRHLFRAVRHLRVTLGEGA
jgi:RNA polymerase sigma-70 factor (ECF subfamily)